MKMNEALAKSPVAMTESGAIAGFQCPRTGLSCFFGIPYAKPPVGALRFRPPVPMSPWQGTREALSFGAAAPQIFDPTEGSYAEFTGLDRAPPGKDWVGDEDCLTLNVWTPAADSAARPVIVWIHGGANWLESSRLATYHGDNFAVAGDVVFVSINYRLGVFGWLDLDALDGGEAFGQTDTCGLRDQLAALQWISRNIAAFGGDPGNITVMGESAGSIDLSWLYANGHLSGLARRVVLMSGIAGLIGLSGDAADGFSRAHGRERSGDFFSRMGVASADELAVMPTSQIMERVVAIARSTDILTYMDSLFWPRVSDFAPQDPFRAVRGKVDPEIDVIIGYTAYEMGLWLFWDDRLDTRPCIDAASRIIGFSPEAAAESASLYDEIFAADREGARGMHLIGDAIFVMPSFRFADALADAGVCVRMYQFDWMANDRQRALHAADQAFLFGKLDTHAASHLLGAPVDAADAAARERLSRQMMSAILDYARGADPAADGLTWPRYDSAYRQVLSFDVVSGVVADPVRARREWWFGRYYEPAGA